MLKKFWHFLIGHNFKTITAVYNKPVPPSFAGGSMSMIPTEVEDFLMPFMHGQTEVMDQCSCGAVRIYRLIGDHSGIKSQKELEELNRMMKG